MIDAPRPWIDVRGIYGGTPDFDLAENGVNAIWLRSDTVTVDAVDRVHRQGARLFAEFNSVHAADFLVDHPDAAPVGIDGLVCPPPDGWQGICPTHAGYRRNRMTAFERVLTDFEIDGIWLDYHHAHASWEQAEPNLPDTCFCDRCLGSFGRDTGVPAKATELLLSEIPNEWINWRCGVFTDWVREYREIRDRIRPSALLGTFHCPWTDTDGDGALKSKLAIDLRAQAAHIDVFSIMPYHARFGHANDIDWIKRQVEWLHAYLGGGSKRIWPIVQISDWGETVDAVDIPRILEAATRPPSTGVLVFNWGSFSRQTEKVEALCEFYRSIAG